MSQAEFMHDDMVKACAQLASRCGARGFDIGYMHDDVPVEEAGWYAIAEFQGTRLMVQDQRSATGAALALAERLFYRSTCKCRRQITLSDDVEGCRWRLVGDEWKSGCDAPPIVVTGSRGDVMAMRRALAEPMTRADRRRKRRKGSGR